MANTISTAFVQQFNRNVYLLAQQDGSKLRGKVRLETQHALKQFYDRLAPTMPEKKISRHQDTPLMEQQHSRRALVLEDWVLADLIDREDEIRMLIDPKSLYAQNFAKGMGRQIDLSIVAAFTAAVEVGQFGGTFVNYPAGNILASGGGGLTMGRVRTVKRMFDQRNIPTYGRKWVVSAQAMEDLLENVEVTSSDYNTVKALVAGTIEGNTWMSFEWIMLADELLPIDANLDRSTFAYWDQAMLLAIARDIMTEMDRRPDKMNALQVMTTMSENAVRLDDTAVLEVLVREEA